MNHSTKKVYFLSVGLGLLLAVVASVFRSILLLNGYTPSLGHFTEGVAADLFLPLLFVLAIVVAIGFGIFFRSSLTNRTLKQTLPTVFASGLSALAMLVWIVVLLVDVIGKGLPVGTARILLILMTLFALIGICHFVYSAISGNGERNRVLLCAALAVFCAFYMLYAYFDTAFTLNSPIKLFDQITFFLLALFFLAECRFHVNKISDATFLPIGMICMVFTAADAVPGLIYAAAEGEALVGNVMHDFLALAFFLYIVARMLSFPLSASEQGKQDAFAAELSDVSDAPYEIDNDTHITEGDPRQETFHFDEEEEATEANADEEAKDTHAEDETAAEEETATNAQTTLEFSRKHDA